VNGLPPALKPWLIAADGDLLVVNKPSGLLCQPGLGPALADSLLTRLRGTWPTAQLVHRLDRDTSGLLLLALTPELHRALSGLFAQRLVIGGCWGRCRIRAGAGWSSPLTPAAPISCGCIWPPWAIRSWGIPSMALHGHPDRIGCGCMPVPWRSSIPSAVSRCSFRPTVPSDCPL
jgi:hypothetical protein